MGTKSHGTVLEAQLSKWKLIAGSLGAGLLGLGLIWFSEYLETRGQLQWASVTSELGSVVVGLALLSLLWEWVGKRALLQDVLRHIDLKSDLLDMGIQAAGDDFQTTVDWDTLFRGAARLDVVFAYANTWRGTNRVRLQAMALKPNTAIRVFLPNPADTRFIGMLAYRFGRTAKSIKEDIASTVKQFTSMETGPGSTVDVFYRSGDLVLSYYLFDQAAVMALYSHSRRRLDQVPTFVLAEAKLLRFLNADLQAIIGDDKTVPAGTGATGG